MEYKEALELVGGVSMPSKMPWIGWSTSAFACKVGTKLREVKDSVCSSCYATKGNYRFPGVKAAHDRRLKALDNPLFVDAMMIVIEKFYARGKGKENRFRWHDSGDIQSVDHLRMIVNIALRLPHIDFWLPTREHKMVKDYLAKYGVFPDNLVVRLSTVMIGEEPKSQPLGLPYSTVGVDNPVNAQQCIAYTQGGKCLDCRACWTKVNINYPKH